MAANNSTNTVDEEDDWVVIECTDPNPIQRPPEPVVPSQIFISTDDISSWDLPFILSHHILQVKANRNRLIEQSSYFHSLLTGNFSESSMNCVSIHWSLEAFLHILRFMHGCHMEVTICNFLPLLHASLYFGVERLALECRNWFSDFIMKEGTSSDMKLDTLIIFWDFGKEHAIDWISGLCISYVARNFMWALSCDKFVDLPFIFLVSCVKHPHLTVDSERHLCEGILSWLRANMEPLEQIGSAEDGRFDKSKQMIVITHDWTRILKEIRTNLLPLWFILGCSRCRYFSTVAKLGIAAIMNLLNKFSKDSNYIADSREQSYMRIRLTKYSKKLDLSGCPQITSSIILFSMLHDTTSVDIVLLKALGRKSIDLECPKWLSGLPTVSCKAMMEVDISKCPLLHLGAALECFRKSFPFLRIVRIAYLLDFETRRLCQLLENNSSVCEVDLTVDVSPLISSSISVLYSESVSRPALKYFDMSSCCGRSPTISNITKLSLEGRNDFSDLELGHIAKFCVSLCYLNIRGCLSVTDVGIANLILMCRKLHSIIANDTSFGRNSASALCCRALDSGCPQMKIEKKHIELSDINLEVLHIGGCKGLSETSLGDILSRGWMLKNLCLRDTYVVDHVLYKFPGSSLEILDVSNTMISRDALSRMITNNPGLKCLDARGCKKLCADRIKHDDDSLCSNPGDNPFSLLGQNCKLEELAIGWGFSIFSLHSMVPALRSLKSINVGLGGSLGPEGLTLLCTLTPLLQSIVILFQMISDTFIINLLEASKNLQALSICYCMGNVSRLILKHSVPNMRKLKLERMTPWMTDDDLALLTHNVVNLIELSLVGCIHLGEDSQQIISSGWPGLISLHLEDCGAVTAKGTEFLFDCKALENLVLRHNGPGIQNNFILDAASNLPMLRSLSLDWCDASEGDFDLPNFADKYNLSNVKISRCKLQKCTLDFQCIEAQKKPVHKETLVLVWTSASLQRTVVKERIT